MIGEVSGAPAPVREAAAATPDRAVLRTATTQAVVSAAGAAVLSLTDRASGVEFLMRTPWAEEDWSDDHPSPSTSVSWHRRYPGGWHTLLPHAGEEREVGGVAHPFHGEAAWRRWRFEEADPSSCTLGIVLRTVPLMIRRRFELHEDTVTVEQTVVNYSREPVSLTWTEHPAFGEALVSPATVVELDGRRLGVDLPTSEEAAGGFRTELSGARGTAVIRNPETGAHARLDWDAMLFPYTHVWQEHRTPGFPWWGAVSCIAIEPATREYWPDDETLGPVTLDGGRELSTRMTLRVGIGAV